MGAHTLGDMFEHSLTTVERKKDGIFYTPPSITHYIVEHTLKKLCDAKKQQLSPTQYKTWLLNLKIVDPACGSGALLLQALDFLLHEHQSIHNTLSSSEMGQSILENNLYGVDKDEKSVAIAQRSLLLQAQTKTLTQLNNTIKCGNSLVFVWEEEFEEVFQNGGFDIVLGNPPYLGAREWKNKEIKKYLIANYLSAHNQFDIYTLFLELGIKLLKTDGTLSFITSNTWLYNQSNRQLRAFILKNTTITELIDCTNIKVFKDALVATVITTLTKATSHHNTRILRPLNNTLVQTNTIHQNLWLNNKHHIINMHICEQDYLLMKKIESHSNELASIATIKLGVKLYEKGKGKPQQTSSFSKEKVYESDIQVDGSYKKYLTGKDIQQYTHIWDNTWVKYGKNLAAPRTANLFVNKRIVLRRIIGERLIATYLDEEYITSQLLHIVKPHNEALTKTLTAILNSKLMIYFFKMRYNRVEKVFPEIRTYELASLPIPKTIVPNDTIDKKVSSLMMLNNTQQKALDLQSQIDTLVYELYDLNDNEIKTLEKMLDFPF